VEKRLNKRKVRGVVFSMIKGVYSRTQFLEKEGEFRKYKKSSS